MRPKSGLYVGGSHFDAASGMFFCEYSVLFPCDAGSDGSAERIRTHFAGTGRMPRGRKRRGSDAGKSVVSQEYAGT